MSNPAFQALAVGAAAPAPARAGAAPAPTLLLAGATGAMGAAVLQRLGGSHRYRAVRVLAREPMQMGVRRFEPVVVDAAHAPGPMWPHVQADVAVVMFDPPRLFYQRERSLWTPSPEQLPALAHWLHGVGVRTLAVVQPHTQARLPEALKRGLANLDEQAVAAVGFERLLLLRSAQAPREAAGGPLLQRLARWMLGALHYMVPAQEQPVRAAAVAELLAAALELAPPGIHIASPERVWRAAQRDGARAEALRWLQTGPDAIFAENTPEPQRQPVI